MLSLLLITLIFVLLGLIFYQDIQYRSVSWILFPLSCITLGIYFGVKAGFSLLAWHTLINILFLALILLLLTLFFYLKYRNISFLAKSLGLGDILFFFCLTCVFTPLQYMLFFCLSLFMTTLLASFISHMRKSIPLAGLQALMLMPLLILDYIAGINLSDDNWILSWLI